jgi:predicted rRNA methylase YqxC with S4 and FtsJ domains
MKVHTNTRNNNKIQWVQQYNIKAMTENNITQNTDD